MNWKRLRCIWRGSHWPQFRKEFFGWVVDAHCACGKERDESLRMSVPGTFYPGQLISFDWPAKFSDLWKK